MAAYKITTSAAIAAPAEHVYGILADYRHGHPSILPKPPFQSLVVEQGGIGTGTVIRVQMHMLGATQTFRATVTEPEPGRVLLETNDNGFSTHFVVESRGENQSYVTFITTMEGSEGIFGRLKHTFFTRLLKPVYEKELAQLAAVATGQLNSA